MTDERHLDVADEEGISILSVLGVLLKHRWMIVLGSFAIAIGAALYTKLWIPPTYAAEAKFLPSGQDISARMTSIAGGLKADTVSDSSVDYYTALLDSPTFLERVLRRSFTTERLGGKRPLLDYFLAGRRGTAAAAAPAGNTIDSTSVHLQRAVAALKGAVTPSASRPTPGRPSPPIMTIAVVTPEPRLSADIANAFLEEIVLYNQSTRNSRATDARKFIEKQLADSRKLLSEAEDGLATFDARNRKIATPGLVAQRARLERAVKVQEEVYITLTKQLELARIEEQENQASIDVIQHAFPPLRESSPFTSRNAATAGAAGFVLFALLAFGIEYLKSIDPEEKATKDFLAIVQDVKGDFGRVKKVFEIESPARADRAPASDTPTGESPTSSVPAPPAPAARN